MIVSSSSIYSLGQVDAEPHLLGVPGTSLCVDGTFEGRCWAIQQLVRPSEVAHLVTYVPLGAPTPERFVDSLARYLRRFEYMHDPVGCDRWSSPARTIWRGGGDCDDFAITGAAALDLVDIEWRIAIGEVRTNKGRLAHAWVEGRDEEGPFFLEATPPNAFVARFRPHDYVAHYFLTRERCVYVF